MEVVDEVSVVKIVEADVSKTAVVVDSVVETEVASVDPVEVRIIPLGDVSVKASSSSSSLKVKLSFYYLSKYTEQYLILLTIPTDWCCVPQVTA